MTNLGRNHAVGEGERTRLACCRRRLAVGFLPTISTHGSTRASGFSLIEVIVAVAILSIAMVGLAHGISTALGSSKESELQTTAAMYAAGLIENLRAEGDLTDGQTDGDCGAELPLYRWTQSITGAGLDGLHQVDVSISNSRSGREIYALRTLLFEVPDDSTNSKKPQDSKSKKKSRGTT